MRKLGRSSKNGNVVAEPQRAPGLVGLLETMRVQMEVVQPFSFYLDMITTFKLDFRSLLALWILMCLILFMDI